ncbi:bifunctional helix-turn-helix transcriptional regulator/GNAT family N-acetyltransferase [Photobacterium nomapromontoriensis]|uniref:bifunctional helix-turn-helix transcriptional regulator/GNAT family N-acetyltransferase n=1 Tax=Photobacterium nomapromontoriensis TaxID=2910237 RepID=UPI003D0DF805
MDATTLRHLARQLVRELGMLDHQCGQLDLTPVQVHALLEIEQDPLTVNQLAERLNVDKSNASRTNASLNNAGLLHTISDPNDGRKQISQLTTKGQAVLETLNVGLNQQVEQFLSQLDHDEITALATSLHRYSRAIQCTKQQQGYLLRPRTPLDNAAMATIVRRVSAEYNLMPDQGYDTADPTLDSFSTTNTDDDSAFWVIERNNRILGGGGIAPLIGEPGICELQKMYFLPELRGRGLARRLAVTALKFARQHGFHGCYLEVTENRTEAITLYESLGFIHISQAMGTAGDDIGKIKMFKTL